MQEGDRNTPRRRFRQVAAWSLAGLALVAVGALLLLRAHNNIARSSDADRVAMIETALSRAEAWLSGNRDRFLGPGVVRNPALFLMLEDVACLRGSPAAAGLVEEFEDGVQRPSFWIRLFDPAWPVSGSDMTRAMDELRDRGMTDVVWFIHALDPAAAPLTPEERDGLFDPGRWSGYGLTHQLWALWQLRRLSPEGSGGVSDELLDRVCRRIATEQGRSIAVTDLWIERVAFLLMAGRRDLVRPRWLERIALNQREDGGWGDRWLWISATKHGRRDPTSNEHATTLAVWALAMARGAPEEVAGGVEASPAGR